jgi:DNA-binding HxlR family transcriptional regulator
MRMNVVTFSDNQEVSHTFDRIWDIFADELVNLWRILGRKWALLLLKNLNAKEAIRFNELKRLMPGISSTVLAERLSELEREGLISKKIYPELPPRVEYSLTVQARELRVIFKELWKWTQRPNPNRISAKIDLPVMSGIKSQEVIMQNNIR